MYEIIFNRRHREFIAHEAGWRRSRLAYSGGSAYIDLALIRHASEPETEFLERRRRACYFNYPRAIAGRITQYALSVEPIRRNADPTLVEDWSRGGLRTNEVMRQISTLLNVYGRAWLKVETPRFTGTPTLAEATEKRLRPFAVALSPFAVTDWAYGDDGKLAWAITVEDVEDKRDPLNFTVKIRRRRLYRGDKWQLFEETPNGIAEVARGETPAGCVPLIPVTEPDGLGLRANHWFEDAVRVSDAILNNESEAQMNTVKQMYGLLVISDSFAVGSQRQLEKLNATSGESPTTFATALARSAAIVETPEDRGISRFISPSGVETATIRQENESLKRELFDVVGLALQSRGTQAQTAESKSWDFRNASQFLAARADLLEQAELAAWKMMAKCDPRLTVPEVIYNRKFAVRDLAESIECLLKLAQIQGGDAYNRALRRAAAEQLDAISPLTPEERSALKNENATETGEESQVINY